jgi:hypothetical protein
MLEAESAGVNEDVEDTIKAIAISGSQRNRYKSKRQRGLGVFQLHYHFSTPCVVTWLYTIRMAIQIASYEAYDGMIT